MKKQCDKPAEKKLIRRQRISLEVRRRIVDDVMDGRSTGAEAARNYSVSEATVHRLVKAELISNPMRSMARREYARSRVNPATDRSQDASVGERRSRRALSSNDEADLIERYYASRCLPTDLAREFGVHKSTVSRILRSARERFPSRPAPKRDSAEWQRRVDAGVALAMAAGRHPGSKIRLPEEKQEAILRQINGDGASFNSVGRMFGVSPTTVRRLVRARNRSIAADGV